jgi:hypothetical protein
MAEGGLIKPSGSGIRNPTSNEQNNGRIVNPPRYPQMTGFSSASKGIARNSMTIRKPGATVK